MELRNEAAEQNFATCPLHLEPAPQEVALGAEEVLVFPNYKRVVTQYSQEGTTELHLYCDDKEISFDEPELFAFGEALAKQSHFRAGAATSWGAGYPWPRVRELLEHLLAEGILLRAVAEEARMANEPSRPSPLPPAVTTQPRTWLDVAEITRELAGRSLEIGYLELVIPVYRIPHMALDAERRQVGEANVFPPALRLDIQTEWRACPHAGTRYQHRRPMNVTGLKAMRMHWLQMMAGLLHVREAYLQRFPAARAGWTVGDLHCFMALVLSIPSYSMMRVSNRIENGELHPVLSSMYRVSDGVRMVMHHMLFSANVEPTRPMSSPITAREIYEFSERNWIFHSDYGVCAGPPALIEEFLRVILDGERSEEVAATQLDPAVATAMAEIDAVFDYVLHGLQAYAIVFSRWPEMARTYEQLLAIIDAWPVPATAAYSGLHERLHRSVEFLHKATRHNTEERREQREQVYEDMHSRSVHALGIAEHSVPLAQSIAAVAVGNDAQAGAHLRTLLEQRLGAGADSLEQLVAALMGFFRQEQAVVRAARNVQDRINQLLGRSPPSQPLTAAHLAIHHRVLSTIYQPQVLERVGGRLPYLVDELEEELGLRIVLRGDEMEIAAAVA